MYEKANVEYYYLRGKAMWAHITTPNTRFTPIKYSVEVLTDSDEGNRLANEHGLRMIEDRTGARKYEEPAFKFSSVAEYRVSKKDKNGNAIYLTPEDEGGQRRETINISEADKVKDKKGRENPLRAKETVKKHAPLLIDEDGNKLDGTVTNGSDITVKFKTFTSSFGTFGELVAVKVHSINEYEQQVDLDNEEF